MSQPAFQAVRSRHWTLAALAALVILGAAIRIWQARESLWVDELHTAWCAAAPLADVTARAAIGNQSPLFFWLEWLLIRLVGTSELTLRLPGIVAGSLLPLTLFMLASRWTGSSLIGLVAAALVVVDPLSIFFATEARPYALIQLLAALHVGLAAQLFVAPSAWRRIAYVTGAALLFHLHYTAALLIPAELAFWGLLRLRQPTLISYRWPSLLLDVTGIAVLFLPALPILLGIFDRRENWAAFVAQRPPWEILELLPWSASALFIVTALAIDSTIRRVHKRSAMHPASNHPTLGLLALCWLLVPLFLAWLATATDVARLFFPRYLAASAPAAILLAALCVGLAPWNAVRLALSAAIIAVALWTSGIAEQFRDDGRVIAFRNENWRSAVEWLDTRLSDEPYPVLVASGLIEAGRLREAHEVLLEDYCLYPVTSLYPIAANRNELVALPYDNPGKLESATHDMVVRRNGAWLIIRGRKATAEQISEQLFSDLETRGRRWSVARRTGGINTFGNVHVFLLIRVF